MKSDEVDEVDEVDAPCANPSVLLGPVAASGNNLATHEQFECERS